ncbi:hypothetical protein [Arenimonas sp.]|uniref:hypothetical protein n=1 Tax=Arenimonas sp. TaxID=1872635 RepID=UPI002E35AB06|nr:hypothetical protein [Arenimonas sp.]HEX4853565.1 hypothetical protein [Arenimonas sp.]
MIGFSWLGLLLATNVAASDIAPAARPAAPHPDCMDARAVTEARHLDERVVLLRTPTGAHRITLAEACPRADGAALLAIAPHGWVCGTGREWLRVGDRDCAIGGVQPLDARGWALALREDAHKNPTPTLATVVVDGKSQPKRRFAPSPEYCVDPRRVRGWHTLDGDIVVTTQPRRGSRERASYRLELTGACPEAEYSTQLSFVSGVGIGWICGNPGDRVILSESLGGMAGSDISAVLSRRGCEIVAVYPD